MFIEVNLYGMVGKINPRIIRVSMIDSAQQADLEDAKEAGYSYTRLDMGEHEFRAVETYEQIKKLLKVRQVDEVC